MRTVEVTPAFGLTAPGPTMTAPSMTPGAKPPGPTMTAPSGTPLSWVAPCFQPASAVAIRRAVAKVFIVRNEL